MPKNLLSKFGVLSSLFDNLPQNVISIDADFESIHFYGKDKKTKQFYNSVEMYKSAPFSEEFYEMLKGMLALQNKRKDNRVSLVLPNSLFVIDTVKLPIIQKSAVQNSLNLAIDAIYKNSNDIKFKSFLLSQNKQNATYNVCGIRKEILDKTVKCIESSGFNVVNVTYSANSAVNGALVINPKLKNENFILLDIKQTTADFSLVIGGKTVGYYSLPFGYNILKTNRIKDEITLFDHTAGDLLVLNAKELAKKKRLTMLGDNATEEDLIAQDEQNALNGEFDEDDEIEPILQEPKVGALYKRTNRKLPKFMLRQEPETEEGFIYENFRIFVKYSLELIRNNAELFRNGMPESIVVNMPSRFNSVFEMVNQNLSGTKVTFEQLVNRDNSIITENLELFGSFYTKKYNKNNNF